MGLQHPAEVWDTECSVHMNWLMLYNMNSSREDEATIADNEDTQLKFLIFLQTAPHNNTFRSADSPQWCHIISSSDHRWHVLGPEVLEIQFFS